MKFYHWRWLMLPSETPDNPWAPLAEGLRLPCSGLWAGTPVHRQGAFIPTSVRFSQPTKSRYNVLVRVHAADPAHAILKCESLSTQLSALNEPSRIQGDNS